jgi:hypothetical protein
MTRQSVGERRNGFYSCGLLGPSITLLDPTPGLSKKTHRQLPLNWQFLTWGTTVGSGDLNAARLGSRPLSARMEGN